MRHEVYIVMTDSVRQREMFWMCDVNRFGYYEERATRFDSEADARVVMRYYAIPGDVRPVEGKS